MKKIILTVFLPLLIILFYSFAIAEVEVYYTYGQFIKMVEEGKVKSVVLNPYSEINGILLENGKEQRIRTYADTGASNDPLLLRFLKQRGVKWQLKTEKEHSSSPSDSYYNIFLGFLILTPLVSLSILIMFIVLWKKLSSLQRTIKLGRSD